MESPQRATPLFRGGSIDPPAKSRLHHWSLPHQPSRGDHPPLEKAALERALSAPES